MDFAPLDEICAPSFILGPFVGRNRAGLVNGWIGLNKFPVTPTALDELATALIPGDADDTGIGFGNIMFPLDASGVSGVEGINCADEWGVDGATVVDAPVGNEGDIKEENIVVGSAA